MASSRDTRNGPDWRDVAQAAEYMEKTLGCVIVIRGVMRTLTKPASIVWIAEAYRELREIGVVKPWASASVSMLTRGAGGTDAALLLLLYELDKDAYRQTNGVQL